MIRFLTALALLFAIPAFAQQPIPIGGVLPVLTVGGSATFNGGIAGNSPCDLLAGGCLSAWSVAERMKAGYAGPLFSLLRDDSQTGTIGILPDGIVDLPTLHSFCDGHDCYITELYDQRGSNNLVALSTSPLYAPLIGYDSNGLPTIVLTIGLSNGAAAFTGGVLLDNSPVGLPTTGSRTMFVSTDNFAWMLISELFGYAGSASGSGLADGSGFVMTTTQADPNLPNEAVFGDSLEQFYYAFGAYSPGYGRLVGELKYNQATTLMQASVLPQSLGCIPGTAVSCNAETTFSATPPHFVPYNTGEGNPLALRMGMGTDGGAYGGRLQSAMIAAYATTPAEDTAVTNSLGAISFPTHPTPCGAVSASLTAAKPGPNVKETPNTYYGSIENLNRPNLVWLVGTYLLNPNYNGALFRVSRQDNGTTYDIGASGCNADALAITQDCSETTCNVVKWFDQSGHNWNFAPPTVLTTPTLAPTGMNGLPCIQFTPATPASFTASIVQSTGVMSVTAVSTGTLTPGQIIVRSGASLTPTTNIVSQISGTTGGIGTYQLGGGLTGNVTSGTTYGLGSQFMQSDYIWPQQGGGNGYGLYQNMTLESIWQTSGSGTFNGPFIYMAPGFQWSINQAGTLFYGHNGGNNLTAAATVSLNQAHFSYLTADAASPQDLAQASDNNDAPDTATTTSTALGAVGTYYQIGQTGYQVTAKAINACVSMLAIYNDVESSTNLTTAYTLAHDIYATP